jgi:ribokinase
MGRVVVFGSSNTDMTVRVPRLPSPGETILGSSFATAPGGKGANQAVAARRAGAEVVFVAAVGADSFGRQALEAYRNQGIETSHIRIVDGASSGVALICVDDNGENMIAVAPGANQELTPEDVEDLPDSVFTKHGVLLVSLEIPVPTAIRALRRGFDRGMVTILNPAPAPALSQPELKEVLSSVTFLTPNRAEALALVGLEPEGKSAPDWGAVSLRLNTLGAAVVLITLGSRGCQVFSAKICGTIPAPIVEAVDTVGAGDAFNGALAAGTAEGMDLNSVIPWASAAGALAVTQRGAQAALPYRDAIDLLALRYRAR